RRRARRSCAKMKNTDVVSLFYFGSSEMGLFPKAGTVNGSGRNRSLLVPGHSRPGVPAVWPGPSGAPRPPSARAMKHSDVTTLSGSRFSGMGLFPDAGTLNDDQRNRTVLGPGPFGGAARGGRVRAGARRVPRRPRTTGPAHLHPRARSGA